MRHPLAKKTGKRRIMLNAWQRGTLRENKHRLKAYSVLWTEKAKAAEIGSLALRRVGFIFGGNRQKKGMIVEAESNIVEGRHYWVYYPKPSEAVLFALASEHARYGGPGDYFRGSVGVISGTVDNKAVSSRNAHIDFMQGNFAFSNSSELSRSLVSKHGGWRQHLLGYLFKEGPSQGIKRIDFEPRSKIQEDIFAGIAKKNGFEVESSRNAVKELELAAKFKEK